VVAACATVPLVAQQAAKPTPTPEAKSENAGPKTPEPPALPVNIKIEVSITDQTGSGAPAKKVVTMIAADRQPTNIRSNANVAVKSPANGSVSMRQVVINVDARPAILAKEPTKVLVNLGLEYLPRGIAPGEEIDPGSASFTERLGLILESGKPLMISQAADPTSDRKITVEVTATILK